MWGRATRSATRSFTCPRNGCCLPRRDLPAVRPHWLDRHLREVAQGSRPHYLARPGCHRPRTRTGVRDRRGDGNEGVLEEPVRELGTAAFRASRGRCQAARRRRCRVHRRGAPTTQIPPRRRNPKGAWGLRAISALLVVDDVHGIDSSSRLELASPSPMRATISNSRTGSSSTCAKSRHVVSTAD